MVSTPANPMKIALQRQTPTTCPRSGTESAVMKIGPLKPSAPAVANSIFVSAV